MMSPLWMGKQYIKLQSVEKCAYDRTIHDDIGQCTYFCSTCFLENSTDAINNRGPNNCFAREKAFGEVEGTCPVLFALDPTVN
mmetsp:Transcript_33278/g.52021  ORF Transcript_33278/g.52021 Transcript_33278/m.52021 type:complete len:83 (-) Transcript_33278:135-383(-)